MKDKNAEAKHSSDSVPTASEPRGKSRTNKRDNRTMCVPRIRSEKVTNIQRYENKIISEPR